ncbi:MAG TPA: hypothetical protein VK625_16580, partial [Flavitalea sp.]|nr:hypothetical protein [Flavitalea sp.]
MDKSTIVIIVNIAYCVAYLIVLIVRNQQYRDLVVIDDKNPKAPFEHNAYTLGFRLLLPLMASVPLVRITLFSIIRSQQHLSSSFV